MPGILIKASLTYTFFFYIFLFYYKRTSVIKYFLLKKYYNLMLGVKIRKTQTFKYSWLIKSFLSMISWVSFRLHIIKILLVEAKFTLIISIFRGELVYFLLSIEYCWVLIKKIMFNGDHKFLWYRFVSNLNNLRSKYDDSLTLPYL